MAGQRPFDPYAILAALERRRVSYVVIGAFARVVQGAEEVTDGVDLVPAIRAENLRRLALALEDLDAARVDGKRIVLNEETLREEPPLELRSPAGELKIVPEPPGTRGGYDDLRRAATREPIGKGPSPSVASTADLARMLAALGREADMPKLLALRRLQRLERDARSSRRPLTRTNHGDHAFRVQELSTSIARETQMHQGANMGHGLCTLCRCHAVDCDAGARRHSVTRRRSTGLLPLRTRSSARRPAWSGSPTPARRRRKRSASAAPPSTDAFCP